MPIAVCEQCMPQVGVTANQNGALGESLILHGQTIPEPLSETIESFVKSTYDVAPETPVDLSQDHALYLNVSTGEGDTVSTRMDGAVAAKWVPAERAAEITRTPGGQIQRKWELMSESAMFPIEVKTGEYAELERNQREILETVAKANTREHPLVVYVTIEQLPEQYELVVNII